AGRLRARVGAERRARDGALEEALEVPLRSRGDGAAVLTLRFAGAGADRTRRDEASLPELLTDGERSVAVVVNLEEPLEHVDRPGLRAAPVVGGGRIERPDLLSAVVVTCERDGGYERERKEQRAGENHDPPHRGPPPRLRSVVEAGNPTLDVENDGLGGFASLALLLPHLVSPAEGGSKEESMDDKLEGKLDQAKGKVKEEAGKLGGDRSTEVGGKVDQGKGKVKEAMGELKEELNDDEERQAPLGRLGPGRTITRCARAFCCPRSRWRSSWPAAAPPRLVQDRPPRPTPRPILAPSSSRRLQKARSPSRSPSSCASPVAARSPRAAARSPASPRSRSTLPRGP